MTLTKIALTVFATVGLTAGTVLAVAEPTPSSLPEAAASACSACPSRSCGTAKCMAAGSACSKTAASTDANACDESGTCRDETSDNTGGPIGPGYGTQVFTTAAYAAEACASTQACSGKACENQKNTKKLTLSLGFGSNGPIVRLTSGETPAPCAEEACNDLAECVKTAVAACACPAGTCEKESCDACPCDGKCEQSQQVVATACEAKPACAAAACSTTACSPSSGHVSVGDAVACDAKACAAGTCQPSQRAPCPDDATVAEAAESSDAVCAVAACDCNDCCCESCDCTTDTACPTGQICPVAVRLHHFQTAGILPNGIRLMATGIAPPTGEAACQGDGCRNYDSYRLADAAELPGRVRLTHVPDIQFFPPGPEFLAANRMIALSEFTGPVAAPRPTSAAPRPSIAGAWGRSIGTSALSFVIDGDRIRGMCDESVLFSGTCSVSQDGQVFGVLDEVRYSDEPNATLLTQSLVDQPFAFRFTRDCDDLIIKDFRCGGMSNEVEVDGVKTSLASHVAAFVCGRYERGPAE